MDSINLTLLGLPGAGKGTQAKKISSEFGLIHIATGDIFRRLIDQGTPLGKKAEKYIKDGNLVPDELTISLIKKVLTEKDLDQGFVLDGFPRTLKQASALTEILKNMNKKLDIAIYIQEDPEVLVKRISGRRVCLNCGASYHIKYNPPQEEGICDKCGEELIQRKDDSEEIVRERIKKQDGKLKKIIKYYQETDKLITIQKEGIEEKFSRIKEIIEVKG